VACNHFLKTPLAAEERKPVPAKKDPRITPPSQDEQTLYLGPEDHLSTIRERIERLSTQQVILVIPAQTHLRSQVAWRLLQRRAQELGKDISIVSSDRQIRALARSVQFQIVSLAPRIPRRHGPGAPD
jgi:hypothetical protein